jgi:thiol-disulfide isomerase/thioredoxin
VARRLSVVVAMLLLVGLVLVAGVHNLRARRQAMQAAAAAHHVDLVPGTATPSNADSSGLGTDIRGKIAPNFTLYTVDGKKVSLADFKGKPVIVNFWATYCGPCKLEMPWFEEFHKKYAAQGLVVLGLDDEDGVTKDEVAKAAQHIGVTYPILMANDKVGTAFGLGDYLPVTYYVSSKGVVVEETPGAPSKDEMEGYIQKTLAAGAM